MPPATPAPNMTPDQFVKLVTYATGQSDRWLFLASQTIVLIIGLLIIRYLVGQLREQRESRDNQEKENREERKQMAILLHDATQVLREVRDFMTKNMKTAVFVLGLCFLAGCATTPPGAASAYWETGLRMMGAAIQAASPPPARVALPTPAQGFEK